MVLKRLKSLQFRGEFVGTMFEKIQGSSRLSQVARRGMFIATVLAGATLTGRYVSAQIDLGTAAPSQPLASLKTVSIPEPDNLKDFIKEEKSAIALGKALFWDMQVGSEGTMSCATCHFHAGVDSRSKHQVHPGPDDTFTTGGGPNYQLTEADYPFHKLSDPNDRSSNVVSDSNDVTGSHGVFTTKFNSIIPGSAKDDTTVVQDPIFNINGTNVRQVTGRQAPSTINAVFNFRNFWDGRAQNEFNGVNPFGDRDPNARVLREAKKGQLEEVRLSINNSSLASQAVGPPLSDVEESGTGRLFPDVGQKFNRGQTQGDPKKKSKKLRLLVPLGRQLVAKDDSVLGSISQYPTPGLKTNYAELVKKAFKDEWWKSDTIINVDANGQRTFVDSKGKKKDIDGVTDAGQLVGNQFTLMDYNFSLFMGLAIQAYESTLVSDDSPFDQYMDAQEGKAKKGSSNALTPQQLQGKDLFAGKAKCLNCHGGGEFTNASVKNVENEKIERMIMGDRGIAVYDNGFYNIGVRPTGDDPGVGGNDPFGNPLSFSRFYQKQIEAGKISPPIVKSRPDEKIPSGPLSPSERVSVDGAFKVPGLRNVELTAPYFHNGGKLTLRQVVEFYNRGGDFHEQNINNLDADIQNLGLSEDEKDALVAFLVSLTDERVRYQREPFDHPQLFIPFGHPGNQSSVTNDGTGQATDQLIEIPAVGKKGGAPLSNFLNVNNTP